MSASSVTSGSWLGLDAGMVKSQIEQLAMGVRDLSWYRKGPRRLRARFAKKVLSSRGRRYPEAVFMAALKTTLRYRNQEARAAWALLSEEEKHKKRIGAAVLLATPVTGLLLGVRLGATRGR